MAGWTPSGRTTARCSAICASAERRACWCSAAFSEFEQTVNATVFGALPDSAIDLISTVPFNLRKGVRLPYQMLWLEFRA